MAHNPAYDRPTRVARIRFSRTELLHLGGSVIVLTMAFSFVLNTSSTALLDPARFRLDWLLVLASFIAVSSGFVLHELAHKVVAQHYEHWAEFRGQFRGLMASLLMAAGTGILFAAPGAVQIWGRVTPKENGFISIVGPGVNFLIAVAAAPVAVFGDISAPFPFMMAVVAVVNAGLCLFNLLPIGNLDGRKVLYWNKPIYFLFLAIAIGLIVFLYLSGVVFLGEAT